jgi:hypothetical protein
LGAKRAAGSLVVVGWRRFFIWADKPGCRIKRKALMPRTGVAALFQQGMNARVARDPAIGMLTLCVKHP